ncbi:MAG: hypothetical protein RIK87_22515 [Fuerstiella sp.]
MSNPYSSPDQQNDAPPSTAVEQMALQLKIITLALVSGAVVFMGIALFISKGALVGEPDLLAWIGIGFAALQAVIHVVVPNMVANQALNAISSRQLQEADMEARMLLVTPVFLQRHIIACALLEGAAFFNIVAYIVSEFWGSLAVAAACIVLMLLKFPTASTVQWWAQDQVREIEARSPGSS